MLTIVDILNAQESMLTTKLFRHFQGLEIVNPQAAEKRVDEANAKYFSPSFSFTKVTKTPLPQ
jgi:hypothetical protein